MVEFRIYAAIARYNVRGKIEPWLVQRLESP